MKKLFLVLFLSITYLGFSQKLKVKKNTILLDGKEIAKMDTEGEIYLFKDLNDSILAKIEFSGREATSSITELWVNVSNPKSTVSNEVSFRPGLTLNPKKMIAGFIQSELNFFDENGIKTEVIDSFFNSTTEREGKKMYDNIIAEEAKSSEWISQFDINSIDGIVIERKTNKIATYIKLKNPKNTDPRLTSLVFVDFEDQVIATVNPRDNEVLGVQISTGLRKDLIVKGFDNKKTYISFDNKVIQNRVDIYTEILKQMYLNGYDEVFKVGVKDLK